MKNLSTSNRVKTIRTRTAAILLLSVLCLFSTSLLAQLSIRQFQAFNASIPGNSVGSEYKDPQVDWYQAKISGGDGAPNNFQWTNTGAFPTAANLNITGGGFPAGAGFVRYINRTAAHPSVNGAPSGDGAFLASRSLDWSGHTTYNYLPNADTIGISIFRDNTASAINTMDYVEVYINTSPGLGGATLLSTIGGANRINRSNTQAPAAPVGWNRYQFQIPDLPAYRSATGGASNVYVIVACYSAGGNNIFLDNWSMPEWPTDMKVVGISVIAPLTSVDVNKNSLNNLMLQMQITTRGSLNPRKIDGMTFSNNSSTAYATDVLAAKLWYTGAYTSFAIANGAKAVPAVSVASPQYNFANLCFGSLSTATGCPLGTTLPTFNLYPGNDNYVWLAYDIRPTAVAGNIVSAAMEQFFTGWSGPSCVGDSIFTVAGLQIPATVSAFTQTPSVSCDRPIDVSYLIPTYSQGTSWSNYNNNDFTSWVNLVGDNGTVIDNYYHDGTSAEILAACPGKSTGSNIDRYACHGPDYTYFPPVVQGPLPNSTYKKRFVQLTQGRGTRNTATGGAYTVKAQAGTYSGSNCIAVFIDWNKDGDFDDTYNTSGVGLAGAITEKFGTVCLTQGNMGAFPPSGATVASYNINVPLASDIVTNVGNAGGPAIIGTVTMRVREIFANSNIHPTNSGSTWGEVEDYKIQVLPDCPTPLSNVRKWVGGTTDWNDPNNWCPSLPTKNDIAYISPGPANMPVIGDSTDAVCRTLRIMPGASLGINATKGSSLQISDDLEIGYGTSTGTGANIAVTSDYTNTLTIPGKGLPPPQGVALAGQSPFRNTAHTKLQVTYTATELRNTFKWKKGDNIDAISIEVASATSAGNSIWPLFQIVAYQTLAPVAFPPPFPTPAAGTKLAVYFGDANVASSSIIYSNPSLSITMPNATGGTQANGNYYTINLIPNSLIWDGISSLVLSFEYKNIGGLNPARAFSLYNESNPLWNVLTLSHNSVDANITGWNIVGPNSYINGIGAVTNSLAPSNPVSAPRTVIATISNQRPRLDFTWHRDYDVFPITVGGDWVNNNRLVRGSPYGTTTPVYTIAGDSGFIAGKSKVIFDPSIRAGVNSPGLGIPNLTYYPTPPGITLVQDMDQEITSTVTSGGNSTIFNVLEIKKSSGTSKVVKQSGSFAPFLIGSYADTLFLTTGELMLNRKDFTLKTSDIKALTVTGGWLRSEDGTGASPGTIQSKFNWKIGAVTGMYKVPFKAGGASVFNFKYDLTSGDIGTMSVATYGTATSNNTPYPVAPQAVSVMSTNLLPTPGADGTPWTVDRFWYVSRTTAGALTGDMTFEYDNSTEGTLTSAYNAGSMKAQRFGTTGWQLPDPSQSDASVSANIRSVTHPGAALSNTMTTWTIVNVTGTQGPLPLELINFNAKAIDRKVKIWWDVMAERNVSMYSVERTADNKMFDVIAGKSPVGPSVDLLSYEAWDNKPLNGLQYYRLATNFTDGTIDYSNLVPVRFGTEGTFAINTVITNGDATLTVNFTYDSQLPYTYMVTDMMGRVVASGENKKAVLGDNAIVIPVVLSNGIYTISLVNSEKAVSQKMFY